MGVTDKEPYTLGDFANYWFLLSPLRYIDTVQKSLNIQRHYIVAHNFLKFPYPFFLKLEQFIIIDYDSRLFGHRDHGIRL